MARRKQITKRSKARLLIYGKPGSRKTTLCATAALDDRSAPVLWIDAGGNPVSIPHTAHTLSNDRAEIAQLEKRLRDNIDVLEIEAVTDLEDIYNWLIAGQDPNATYARLNQLRGSYRSIVIDGITHVQRMGGDAIMGTTNLAPGRVPPQMQWPHYRQALGQMIIIASRFYTLPLHIIVTALEHTETRFVYPDDQSSAYQYREPALYGASVDEFPGWALSVGRAAVADSYDPRIIAALKADSAYSIIQFKPTRYVDAKDQHKIGDYVADPTIAQFLDIFDPVVKQ